VRIAVLNGVNLDVLHRREPKLYGGISLNQLESRIYGWARELELLADCRHTNMEGLFVAWCHDALDWAGGVVVNPGAWTHYSYAIHDAIELLEVPVVEVHLSDIENREEWRRHSVIADVVAKRVMGKGPDGYREALEFLAEQRG
jgi:3-dehydroquinate dehydratase-2